MSEKKDPWAEVAEMIQSKTSERSDHNVSSNHYDVGGVSVQQIWEAKLSYEELKGLYKGNILKYIMRADHKNGIEDYRKAKQYFDWLLELVEKGKPSND